MAYPVKFRINLLILPLLFAASSLFAQTEKSDTQPSKEVVKYLNRVQQIIRKNALVADSIDWPQLSNQVKEKSKGLTTIEECKPVLDHILSALRSAGDKHTVLLSKEKAARQTAANYTGQQAESRYVGNGIGYIKIPAFSSMNSSVKLAFSEGIRSQLEALATQNNITGWVVDLRHNTGGNMHPMIDGLQALLGDETYGYFIFPRHKKVKALQTRNRKEQRVGQAANAASKIAVLIDSRTGSSGEMVAIAFKGLNNAKFFGQPSAGYTTVNNLFTLSDGSYLFLAMGYMADRNRNTYLPNIAPDVAVDPSADAVQDKTLATASQWLLEGQLGSRPSRVSDK